jgi:RNA methyltransferase, TrmH family
MLECGRSLEAPIGRASAGRRARGRPHERELARICGLAAVRAVFERDPDRVERLFFAPRLRAEASAFCALLAGARKPYREIEAAELARVAGTQLHGGIAAIARLRPPAPFDPAAVPSWARAGTPLLILDGVSNPHNLGAIARTAAFFGIERMLLADRPDQARPSDASYRVAEGGLECVALYTTPLAPALAALRPLFRIVGTGPDGTDRDLAARSGERRRDLPPALILGNEERGLDRATRAACDEVATIPGSGRVQSLNVAAAAAILIYGLTCGGIARGRS